jgi:hypothetical protein
MKSRERGGFSCQSCRQYVQVYRVDRHQYLASIQEITTQQEYVTSEETPLAPL